MIANLFKVELMGVLWGGCKKSAPAEPSHRHDDVANWLWGDGGCILWPDGGVIEL